MPKQRWSSGMLAARCAAVRLTLARYGTPSAHAQPANRRELTHAPRSLERGLCPACPRPPTSDPRCFGLPVKRLPAPARCVSPATRYGGHAVRLSLRSG